MPISKDMLSLYYDLSAHLEDSHQKADISANVTRAKHAAQRLHHLILSLEQKSTLPFTLNDYVDLMGDLKKLARPHTGFTDIAGDILNTLGTPALIEKLENGTDYCTNQQSESSFSELVTPNNTPTTYETPQPT